MAEYTINKIQLPNEDICIIRDENAQNKLNSIETGAQVNTVTGVKGNKESTYRIGEINLTPENIGAHPANSLLRVTNNSTYAETSGDITTAPIVQILDNNDYIRHQVYGAYNPTSQQSRLIIATRMPNPSNSSENLINDIQIGFDANGNRFYSVSAPAEFRTAISAKAIQTAVSSPSASGTTTSFIDTISQNAQGVITATKKTIPNASTTAAGLMSSTDKIKLDGIPSGAAASIIINSAAWADIYSVLSAIPITRTATFYCTAIGSSTFSGGNYASSTIKGTVTNLGSGIYDVIASVGEGSSFNVWRINGLTSASATPTITGFASFVKGVKGNAESSYRTGNVNLTPANIGAVNKTGDTMTGALYINNGSGNGVQIYKSSEGGNVRIWGADGESRYEIDANDSNSIRLTVSNSYNTIEHTAFRIIDNNSVVYLQLHGTSQNIIQHMRKVNESSSHLGGFIVFNNSGSISFYEYPTDNTTSAATNREWYNLPTPTAGRTAEQGYSILTSKSAVTISQGGTGRTSWGANQVVITDSSGALSQTSTVPVSRGGTSASTAADARSNLSAARIIMIDSTCTDMTAIFNKISDLVSVTPAVVSIHSAPLKVLIGGTETYSSVMRMGFVSRDSSGNTYFLIPNTLGIIYTIQIKAWTAGTTYTGRSVYQYSGATYSSS